MPQVMQLLLKHVEGSRVSLSAWQNELNENGDNSRQSSHQRSMQRAHRALVCLDEARELIKDEEPLLFQSFWTLHSRWEGTSLLHFIGTIVRRVLMNLVLNKRLFPPIYSTDTIYDLSSFLC